MISNTKTKWNTDGDYNEDNVYTTKDQDDNFNYE